MIYIVLFVISNGMSTPIENQRLTSDCIALSDENDLLKEQAHELSKTLIKFMSISLKMTLVMNRHGLSNEVNSIIEEYV